MKRIGLLFDCLRAPYDAAHILQVAAALGQCDIYVAGNSIDLKNKKIKSKIFSWNIEVLPEVESFVTLDEAVLSLRGRGLRLVGTSPASVKSLYDIDLTKGNVVFVFGTESTGLSLMKQAQLDDMVAIPMPGGIPFLTLTVVVPIVAFEYFRQLSTK